MSVIVGVLLQWKLTQSQEERQRRDERIQRVASVLGRMTPLLGDLRPDGIVTATVFIVRSFYDEPWRSIRAELGVLVASEPASDLRKDLLRLDETVEMLFRRLLVLVDNDLRQQVTAANPHAGNVYENAKAQYVEATTLLRKILDDLHGAQSVPKRPGIGPQRQAAEGPETVE